MTETSAAVLDALKQKALARRRDEDRGRRELHELAVATEARELRLVLACVYRDHPYLEGHLDLERSGFPALGDENVDYAGPGELDFTKVRLFAALPFHEPVALGYARDRDGDWKQARLGQHYYRLEYDWTAAPDRKGLVESADWFYTSDLGEALLEAELSYRDRCQKALEARQALKERAARAGRRRGPLGPEESIVHSLMDVWHDLQLLVKAREAVAVEAGLDDDDDEEIDDGSEQWR